MVKVLIKTKGSTIRDKILNVTRKCMELKDKYPYFSWQFHDTNGHLTFSASHWSMNEKEEFQLPLFMIEVDEKYKYIMDQLDELKWSALFYKKEEEHG